MKLTTTHASRRPLRRESVLALALGAVILSGTVAACDNGNSSAADASAAKASAAQPTAHPTVSSNIRSGGVLRHPLVWRAAASVDPGATVDHVDFLVDGKVRWTEHNPPYEFNEGRLLAPWPLGSGRHTLAVRASTSDGTSQETSANVTVKVDPSAATLPTGDYYRTVRDADIRRVSGYRDTLHGAFGEVPPTGRWELRVLPDGVVVLGHVRDTEADWARLPFQTRGDRLTLYGPGVWLQPNPDHPYLFCDPEPPATYRWTTRGPDLTISTVARTCADRDEVLIGTWRRG